MFKLNAVGRKQVQNYFPILFDPGSIWLQGAEEFSSSVLDFPEVHNLISV
jgi:hypothetical protein